MAVLSLEQRRKEGMAPQKKKPAPTAPAKPATTPATKKPIVTTQHGRIETTSGRAAYTNAIGTAPTSITDTEPEWLKYAPSMGGDSGGGGSSDTSINDYYAEQLKAREEAARQRTQYALDANNAYIPQINTYQDKRLQDAYIAKEMNRVNLPQQLAAVGYSGGATETSMTNEMTNYENNRNNIEQDRNKALNDIYQNAAQIQATGDAGLADISAQYYQNMITKAQRDAETAQSNYRWQTEFDASQANDEYQNKLDMAKLKAAYGDYSGLQALGISVNALNDMNGSTPATRSYSARAKAATINAPASSGNYSTVLTNVKRALGGSNAGSQTAWNAAINYIQNSLRQGVITENEAQQMLGQLGLS